MVAVVCVVVVGVVVVFVVVACFVICCLVQRFAVVLVVLLMCLLFASRLLPTFMAFLYFLCIWEMNNDINNSLWCSGVVLVSGVLFFPGRSNTALKHPASTTRTAIIYMRQEHEQTTHKESNRPTNKLVKLRASFSVTVSATKANHRSCFVFLRLESRHAVALVNLSRIQTTNKK